MVRATEILGPGEALMEMSIRERKAEQIVSGLEQPINLHLLKLLGSQADPDMRQHWKRELETWLLRIAAITLKPDDTPIPAKVVYQWLYDETFGGSEQRNVEMMLRFLARDYPRNEVDTSSIVAHLRSIHEQLAQRIARNDPGADIVDAL
jgi:hypothetical protein